MMEVGLEDMLFDVREKEEELISRWVEENVHKIIACETCVEGVFGRTYL